MLPRGRSSKVLRRYCRRPWTHFRATQIALPKECRSWHATHRSWWSPKTWGSSPDTVYLVPYGRLLVLHPPISHLTKKQSVKRTDRFDIKPFFAVFPCDLRVHTPWGPLIRKWVQVIQPNFCWFTSIIRNAGRGRNASAGVCYHVSAATNILR